jgi:restriction system protein
MSIPDFQTIMLPLLELIEDGQEYKLSEAIDLLATHFKLTTADRKELLPSGKQARFNNRVGWASTHMRKAGLLVYPSWGKFKISQRGLTLLHSKPDRITTKRLRDFPEYLDFIGSTTTSGVSTDLSLDSNINNSEQTPDEEIDSIYQKLRFNLAQEMLEKIKNCSPTFFEQL